MAKTAKVLLASILAGLLSACNGLDSDVNAYSRYEDAQGIERARVVWFVMEKTERSPSMCWYDTAGGKQDVSPRYDDVKNMNQNTAARKRVAESLAKSSSLHKQKIPVGSVQAALRENDDLNIPLSELKKNKKPQNYDLLGAFLGSALAGGLGGIASDLASGNSSNLFGSFMGGAMSGMSGGFGKQMSSGGSFGDMFGSSPLGKLFGGSKKKLISDNTTNSGSESSGAGIDQGIALTSQEELVGQEMDGKIVSAIADSVRAAAKKPAFKETCDAASVHISQPD